MYLHLGNETVVRTADVIGIFDLDKTSTGPITREFLRTAEQRLQVTNVAADLPRSFVVCLDDAGMRIYLSQIAAPTLQRRAGRIDPTAEAAAPLHGEKEEPL